jgi:hypothetical protein
MTRFLCGLVCLVLPAPLAAQPAGEPKHLREARLLVKQITPKHNSYEHKVDVVKWKGDPEARFAECHTDCSGLLNALLGRVYALGRDDLKEWLGKKRPVARDYHQAIMDRNGFQRVTRVQNLKPGDVLAIRYPEGLPDTGHILVVAEAPRRRDATAPVIEKTEQWEVKVIDCSRSGHGTGDTRHKPDGSFNQGIGEGTFRLYAHKSGTIAGYSWSPLRASTFYAPDERNLVAGRLTLPVKKTD